MRSARKLGGQLHSPVPASRPGISTETPLKMRRRIAPPATNFPGAPAAPSRFSSASPDRPEGRVAANDERGANPDSPNAPEPEVEDLALPFSAEPEHRRPRPGLPRDRGRNLLMMRWQPPHPAMDLPDAPAAPAPAIGRGLTRRARGARDTPTVSFRQACKAGISRRGGVRMRGRRLRGAAEPAPGPRGSSRASRRTGFW